MCLSQEACHILNDHGTVDLFSDHKGNTALAVLNYIQQNENPPLSEFARWCFDDTVRRVLVTGNCDDNVVLRTVLSYLCIYPAFFCLYYADMESDYQRLRLKRYLIRSKEPGLFDTVEEDYHSRQLEAKDNGTELKECVAVVGLNLIQDEDGTRWDWFWDFVKPIVPIHENTATDEEESLTTDM